MTRETKIGLLVGMGVIILVAILVSDYMAPIQTQQPARLANEVRELDNRRADNGFLRNRRNDLINRTIDQNFNNRPLRSPKRPSGRLVIEPPAADQNDPVARALADASREAGLGVRSESRGGERFNVIDLEPPTGPQPASGPTRPGPTLPPDQPTAPQPAVHIVQSNQTLSDVSRQYYGSPHHWKKIYQANRNTLRNPNVLKRGMKLVIPDAKATAPSAGPAPVALASAAGTRDYKIQENQTLSDVAQEVYGSAGAWGKLYALNKDRIRDPNRIKPGMVIRVPRR